MHAPDLIMSFLLSARNSVPKKPPARAQSGKSMVDAEATVQEERTMEGYLWVRIHARRRRYCVLQGRTLHVYDKKEDAFTPQGSVSPKSKKQVLVIAVKDAVDLDKHTRTQLLGGDVSDSALENALVISTTKSKLVAVEAETHTEKQRWLHAMSCLNFATAASEKTFFQSLLQDKDAFDAHTAVTLLHRYRDNALATELVIDRLAEYAEHNIDDVEFYIQQIMHLVVNVEMAKTEKLVNLLLSISKAKAYVEHLGNCIHLALQLFWLLEAKIQDKDPKTYNLCAKLLMSIEANVVNQQFEVSTAASSSPDAVSKMLLKIPGMNERLAEMRKQAMTDHGATPDSAKASGARPEELTTPTAGNLITVSTDSILSPEQEEKLQRELLMQWMEKERQKRYKYFHDQRDFVKSLTDISERMRFIEPPTERKKHLPAELEELVIPSMAYIPLGRVSDPYSRITRVLKDEGTVFSTHSRAPCLLCFEVVQDHVNAAGHRASFSKQPSVTSPILRTASASNACGSATFGSVSSSAMSFMDEEVEVFAYIKKYSMKGKWITVEDQHGHEGDEEEEGEDDDEDNVDVEHVAVAVTQDAGAERVTQQALERHLNIPAATPDAEPSPSPQSGDASNNISRAETSFMDDASVEEPRKLIRHGSRATYEYSLSKLMSECSAFGERWREKKERIRATSPYGKLPGWNVVSLISKSNDDIRQEVFAMQLISKFQEIFCEANLPLWLRPYRIISTGRTSGLIETLTDAQSLDALKKKLGYQSLRAHFERTYGAGDVNSKDFKTAQRNFLQSLAAYSIVCYLLQIKDRHNGNIMLDTEGRLIHIDFGFMLGIAPGGNWSIEMAPFKLTKEMVEVLGGVDSKLFGEFVHLFARGLLAAQRQAEKIITLVEIMMRNSTFPCFQGRDVSKDLQKLRDRFLLHHTTEQTVKAVMKLVGASYKSKWTKRYDQFQKLTNGIVP